MIRKQQVCFNNGPWWHQYDTVWNTPVKLCNNFSRLYKHYGKSNKATTLQHSATPQHFPRLFTAFRYKLRITHVIFNKHSCTTLLNTGRAPNVKLAINSFPRQDFPPPQHFLTISRHLSDSCQINVTRQVVTMTEALQTYL